MFCCWWCWYNSFWYCKKWYCKT